MTRDQKLERFATQQLKKNPDNLVITDDEGNHIAFGRYLIKAEQHCCRVYDNNDDLLGSFANCRTAMSYCVADKYRRFNLAANIKILDSKRQILANDIATQRGLADKSRSAGFREIVMTKLAPKTAQLKAVENELEKCVISAKYLQLKGFQNETARVFTN
jgi:hypothetical protein